MAKRTEKSVLRKEQIDTAKRSKERHDRRRRERLEKDVERQGKRREKVNKASEKQGTLQGAEQANQSDRQGK